MSDTYAFLIMFELIVDFNIMRLNSRRSEIIILIILILIIFKKEQKKIEFFLKSIFKNVLLFDVNFLRNFFFNFKIFVLKIFFLEIDVLFNILDLFVYKTKYKTV